jgi:hypothetical protein
MVRSVERGCPKASGLAYEVDSASGPQAASALEVCETSAIGRALANAGYSGTNVPPVRRWRRSNGLRKLKCSVTGSQRLKV